MIKYSSAFIIMAIISAILGYGQILGAASGIAKVIFFVFIVLYISTLLRVGVTR